MPQFDRVHDYLWHWSRRTPAREALIGSEERISYGELAMIVEREANALMRHGVGAGDRVAVMSAPRPAFFATFLAIASVGGVYLGLNPKNTDSEISFQLGDAAPKLLVSHGDSEQFARARRLSTKFSDFLRAVDGPTLRLEADVTPSWSEKFETLSEAVSGDDPVAIVYTSGSTGTPKGAVLPHRGFTECYAVQNRRWLTGEGEISCVVEPINHVAALGDESFALLAAGGTVVYLEQFDADELLGTIGREGVTFWYTDPAVLSLCRRSSAWDHADFSSLRRIVWSGGRAPMPLVHSLRLLDVALGTSWGMTETVGSLTYTDDDASDDVLAHTLGKPDGRFEMTVLRPDGTAAAAGEVGELCARGDIFMIEYLNRPEDTSATVDEDGWLHTGDLVTTWPDGNLELVGRVSDMFKSGGENIYPREVEQAVESHTAVTQAVVVPRLHELWGEVGHAYVVATGPLGEEELRSHLRTRLARYKIPKTIEFVHDLPLLGTGKIDRLALARLRGNQTTNGKAHR